MTNKAVLTGVFMWFVLAALTGCSGSGGGGTSASAPNSPDNSVSVNAVDAVTGQLSANRHGVPFPYPFPFPEPQPFPFPVPAPPPPPAPVPAPQAGVIALPKTGQTTCYDTSVPPVAAANGCLTAGIPPGQDGASRTGVAEPRPRFTVDGTGACVTDNLTGLMWTQNANLPAGTLTWQQALDFANLYQSCGFNDWRLPNRKELRSLANYSLANNADTLNTTLGFSNVQASYYWSSSSYVGSPANAWVVNIPSNEVFAGDKSIGRYVWPVRDSGQL